MLCNLSGSQFPIVVSKDLFKRSHEEVGGQLMRFVGILFFLVILSTSLSTAQIPTPRQEVLEAEKMRPSDPWPRGRGHVILAAPGSLETVKAYHEPGGSFSPEFGSFGVSLWITDSHGTLLETSDSIPLPKLRQRFVWHDNVLAPSIYTDTDEYTTEWSVGPKIGSSQLLLTPKLTLGHKLMLALRSVGPAGAAIESLQWSGKELVINGRYTVRVDPSPVSIYVGPEGPPAWTTQSKSVTECHELRGWCYARLELPLDRNVALHIIDAFPPRPPQLTARSTRSTVQISVPDPRFADSLNAQVAHLMMGLVDNQTRPGDPNQYPLSFLRDGAYQLVALARAGELETARELTRYFAEKDFFGGFGAEGDNPGMALWAMEQVAGLLRDPAYDQYLWPHASRKAEFILGMMTTREPIERVFAQTLVPIHRTRPDIFEVAQPPKDGLIEGRMDLFHPALYVSASSYYGLLSAAELADRLHHTDESSRWRTAAAKIKRAWNNSYQPTDPDDRTFLNGVSSLSWIADSATYRQGLERSWSRDWDPDKRIFRDSPYRFSDGIPLWTYFVFETADQFLLMGQPQVPWDTLQWFWDHQPAPGLYSWWESNKDENTFHEWEYVRGWVHPPHVTPHYQSAAACLLLQLDMLAYLDASRSLPTIVIGGGLPRRWSQGPMHVHGILTQWGRLDWDWDGKAMFVKTPSNTVAVRLGSAFPEGAKITVSPMQQDAGAN
jgi:hypothetical protein